MDINPPNIDPTDIDLTDVSRRSLLGALGVGVGGTGGITVLVTRDDPSNDDEQNPNNDTGVDDTDVNDTDADDTDADDDDDRPPNTVVLTDDHTFRPASLTVSVGTTVVWENVGSAGHSVTAYGDELPDGAAYFASGKVGSEVAARNAYPSTGKIRNGEIFEHTFQTTGTYEYFCVPHEDDGMTGTVEVV